MSKIRETVEAAITKKRDAEKRYRDHLAAVAPIWNATVDAVGPMLAVRKDSGGEQYRKFADDVAAAHTELMFLGETIAKQVAAPYAELADAARARVEALAEAHAMQHNISLDEAHKALAGISSDYRSAHATWAKTLDDKANAVAAAQMEVDNALMSAQVERVDAARQSNATTTEMMASEKAVRDRAAELAKHRGVSAERAMTEGLGSGAHGDDTLKSLYATASRDRAMLPYGGRAS